MRTPSRQPVGGELEFHEEASVDKSRAESTGGPSWVIQGEDDVVRPRGMKHAPPDRGR
ncbi:hypothetical protein [Burkholderia ambifaria]|uniref:hypothetical protein n=1 Tax=Burkholderia ambifaria TaxID=152480 RepID=UPI002FE167B7